MAMNTAKRNYLARFWPVMVLYVLAVFGVSYWFNTSPPDGVLKYLLAIVPALPIIAVFFVMGRYLVEETDEFVRLRQMIALLLGIGITLTFCVIWGFLEIYADVPRIGLFNIVWGFFLSFGIGHGVANWWFR